MTTSVIGLRSCSNVFPKAKLAPPKKVMITVSWSAAHWIHYSFLKPLHLRSMLIKSMRCTKNCNACSRHRQSKGYNSFPWQRPTVPHTTNASKGEWIGLQSFASSAIFTWSLANWLPLLQASRQLFAGKTLPQSVGGRKCFPKAHQYPKYGFLHYRNKLISHWQKCVDCNGSYFY